MFKTKKIFSVDSMSDVNDDKMLFAILKWLSVHVHHLYKKINVIIVMQKLYFKNITGNNGIQLS